MECYDLTPEEADVFFDEAIELLESLDSDLVLLEHSSDDNLVQRIFRAFHTLKGAAGSIGHDPMAHLTHAAETVLDRVRQGEMVASTPMVDILFDVVSELKRFLDDVRCDRRSEGDVDGHVAALDRLLNPDAEAGPPALIARLPPLEEKERESIEQGLDRGLNLVVVYAEADPDGVAPLARLLQLSIQMEEIGQIVSCSPAPDALENGEGGHVLVAVLLTPLARPALENELNGIFDLLALQVADLSNAVHLLFDPGDEIDQEELAAIDLPPLPELPGVAAGGPAPTTDQTRADGGRRPSARTVRTSVESLDSLLNLAGELVTDRNRLFTIYEDLSRVLGEEHLFALNETITHLSTLTDRLHDQVFKARMQPIEYVFNKFPRLVRQIAQELGKQIELTVTGQDTEVDRSVIEHVADPLLHLVRNAIDHGIEPAAKRLEQGKPPTGRLHLSAHSEEGSIVITVTDDGMGIDAEKVKAKALALGLIGPEQAAGMSYAEAIDLVFAPGLSTAAQLSSISGRGVGMDVVRSSIQQINGTAVAHSRPGIGTTFELRLPLTLAIVPGLLVEAQDQVFALPLHNVVEIFKLEEATVRYVRGREVVYMRNEILPLCRLDGLFDPGGGSPRQARHGGGYVVSLSYRDTQVGVVVEGLLGKQDVVIKSLGYPLNKVKGLTGATLLGDGRIGLIVDIAALVETTRLRGGVRVTPVSGEQDGPIP